MNFRVGRRPCFMERRCWARHKRLLEAGSAIIVAGSRRICHLRPAGSSDAWYGATRRITKMDFPGDLGPENSSSLGRVRTLGRARTM